MAKLLPAQRKFIVEQHELNPEVETPARRLITPDIAQYYDLIPPWTMAIDPGETCGMAWSRFRVELIGGETVGSIYQAKTVEYNRCHDAVEMWAQAAQSAVDPVMVIEEYRIYPDKAMAHSGKTIPTSECIGGLKFIARRYGVRVVEQPADAKGPTRGMLRARRLQALGDTDHAKDAEIHLWHYAFRRADAMGIKINPRTGQVLDSRTNT